MLDKLFSILSLTLDTAGVVVPIVVTGKAGPLVQLALRLAGEAVDATRFLAENANNLTPEDMAKIELDLVKSRDERNAKIEALRVRIASGIITPG